MNQRTDVRWKDLAELDICKGIQVSTGNVSLSQPGDKSRVLLLYIEDFVKVRNSYLSFMENAIQAKKERGVEGHVNTQIQAGEE